MRALVKIALAAGIVVANACQSSEPEQTAKTPAPLQAAPPVIEFHMAQSGGWPKGTHKVELSADGTFIIERPFVVE